MQGVFRPALLIIDGFSRRMTSQIRKKQSSFFSLIAIALVLLAAYAVRTWYESQQHRGVESEAERRANRMPDDLQAQLDWGSILAQQSRVHEAVTVFAHAAQIAPRDTRPYMWLGVLAVQDHRLDYARANFVRAAQINPSDPAIWRALGDLYSQAHLKLHAIDAYEHTIRLQPKDEIAWRQLGVLETEAKLLSRGYDALTRATRLKPDDLNAWIDLGNCALITGHLPQAKQAFDRVLTDKPEDPTALLGDAEAGMQLDASPSGLARAEQQAERALTLNPTPHTHQVIGRIALARKEYARAASELNASLAVKSNDISSYGYLSQAYAGLGRPDLARKASVDYQRADASAHSKPLQSDDRKPHK